MESYLAFKRNDSSDTHNRMDELEDIMLSEISQSQNDKYYMIPLTGGIQSSQTQKQRVQQCLLGAGVSGYGESLLNSYRVSLWGDGKDLATVVMVAQQRECN